MPESSCQQAVHPGGQPARRMLIPPPEKEEMQSPPPPLKLVPRGRGADISTGSTISMVLLGRRRHCSSYPFILSGPWTALDRAHILNTPKLRRGGIKTLVRCQI